MENEIILLCMKTPIFIIIIILAVNFQDHLIWCKEAGEWLFVTLRGFNTIFWQ
jgi:hypothetical protein